MRYSNVLLRARRQLAAAGEAMRAVTKAVVAVLPAAAAVPAVNVGAAGGPAAAGAACVEGASVLVSQERIDL